MRRLSNIFNVSDIIIPSATCDINRHNYQVPIGWRRMTFPLGKLDSAFHCLDGALVRAVFGSL